MAKKLIKDRISSRQLEKMWKSFDLVTFWAKVIQKVSEDADAYAQARAKSKGVRQVFI